MLTLSTLFALRPQLSAHVVRFSLAIAVLSVASCSEVQQVSNSGQGAFGVDIAVSGSALPAAVAWYDTRHENTEIYLRLLDEDLLPASQEWRLTKSFTDAYEPDIVIIDEHVAVVWYEESDAGSRSGLNRGQVYFGLYDRRGEVILKMPLSDSDVDARIPLVSATADALFVAWLQGDINNGRVSGQRQLMGTWLKADGEIEVAPHAIAPASASTWNLNAAVADRDSGRVIVVYDAEFETAVSELYAVEVTPENSQLNRLTADDGYASKYPDLALSPTASDTNAALTWFDELYGNSEIYLLQLPDSALFFSDVQNFLELEAIRVTESEGDSIGAYLAWQEDRLALVWSEPIAGRYEIFYQLWGQDHERLTDITRLTSTRGDSYIPSVAARAGKFALAWSEVSEVGPLRDAQLSRSEIAVQYIE